jgi:uncharacterized protein DUF6644
LDWLAAVENSALGELVRRSALLYAALQIAHLLAMAALVGAGLVLDVRLLGLTRMPLAQLLRFTDPVLQTAAAVALVTGLAMFSAEATTIAANPAFKVKIVVLGMLIGNALGFQLGARRSLASWADSVTPPLAARAAGGIAIIGWVSTVVAARLIAFV